MWKNNENKGFKKVVLMVGTPLLSGYVMMLFPNTANEKYCQ